jgi:dienelactone hydrolase
MNAYDPFVRGPFPVGVRTIPALDAARGRDFPCEIWYPATTQYTGQDLDPKTQDRFAPRLNGAEQNQMTVRDAVARPGVYPFIIFSHHSGGHRRTSTFLCTHLSSHGYVLAALDHSEVIAPELARRNDENEEQKKARWQSVIDSRVPDVRFLLDHMLAPNCRDHPDVELDASRIGIVGHSFGGWTALAMAEIDSRIRAIVALAPGGTSNPRPGILPVKLTFRWKHEVPALYLVAENDVPLPLAGMYELFERAPSPKQMVILRRADHLHFIDNVEQQHEAFRTAPMPAEVAQMQKEMRPITELCSGEQAHLWVRGLTLAHMDAFLSDRHEAHLFLAGDIEGKMARYGVDVILHKEPPAQSTA